MHELAHLFYSSKLSKKNAKSELDKAETELRAQSEEVLQLFQESTYGISFSHSLENLDSSELYANVSVVLRYHQKEFLEKTKHLKQKEREAALKYALSVAKSYGVSNPLKVNFAI